MRKANFAISGFFLALSCLDVKPSSLPLPSQIVPAFYLQSNPLASRPVNPYQYNQRDPLEIIMIGDSLAGGAIPSQLKKLLSLWPAVSFENYFKESSSLVNNWFFDWQAQMQGIFKSKHLRDKRSYDIIIVELGANDGQAIILATKRVLSFGSELWQAEFANRCLSFMQLLTSHAKTVIWLSVPPMSRPGYRERIMLINQIQEFSASQLANVIFLDLAKLLADEQGNPYRTKLIDGQLQLLRWDDGIHLTSASGLLIAREVTSLIGALYQYEAID